MDLIKGTNKVCCIVFLVLFMNCKLIAENKSLTFGYNDSINNKSFIIQLNSNKLDLIDFYGNIESYLLDDKEILSKVQSLFNKKEIFLNPENLFPVVNCDVTETLVITINEESAYFLFHDNFILINNIKYNEEAVLLIKDILNFMKNKDNNELNNLPTWLFE